MLTPTVLRPNATTVYRFLSIIRHQLEDGETLAGRKILDCGAGGPVPPLAVFAEQGMEAQGIDHSERQLRSAQRFCLERGIDIRWQLGDMRSLPFEDGSFDYVYEHYSVCHLTPAETKQTIDELRRVLKPGGLALFGVISKDSWPQSRWAEDEGDAPARHSLFSDREASALLDGWDLLLREKVTRYLADEAEALSEEEWMALRSESRSACSETSWRERYPHRRDDLVYVHDFYFVKKP